MNTRLARAISGCALLALSLTACGDDSGERTEEWAKEFCDQLPPQVERVREANEAIAEVSDRELPPAEVQEVYSSAFGELSGAFESLAGAVDDAGDPPVGDGEELRTAAVAEYRQVSEAYGDLKTDIDELDTSDREAFAEGLRGMVTQLERLGESDNEALAELSSGELGEAMARQEGCRGPVPVPGGEVETGGDGAGEETEPAEEGSEEDGTEDENADDGEG